MRELNPVNKPRSVPAKVLRWVLLLTAALLVIALIATGIKLLVIHFRRKHVSSAYAISEVREYQLGGHKQKVLIEGRARDLPIVLYLHGGPGTPLPFNVGSRGMVPQITDQNILVTWDQYGSGINNAKLDASFSLDTLAGMAKDLVLQLKADFPDNRLTLFAVSWGSVLSARLADELPELIDEVVVYGQISNHLFMNEEVFGALQQANLPQKDQEQLREIMGKDRFAQQDVDKVAGWLNRYTEGYFAKGSSVLDYLDLLAGSFISPDYRLGDALALFNNGYSGEVMDPLIMDLVQLDLIPVLQRVSVPYTILQGEKDLVTSTRAIKRFAQETDNSNIKLEIIEESAHMPSKKALEYVLNFDHFR